MGKSLAVICKMHIISGIGAQKYWKTVLWTRKYIFLKIIIRKLLMIFFWESRGEKWLNAKPTEIILVFDAAPYESFIPQMHFPLTPLLMLEKD